jgi:group I intron endonuclease
MKINLKSLMYDNSLTIDNEVNVIYLIINLINDHKYVGQAKNLFDRFRSTSYISHKSKYEDSTIKTYLYNALRKYGLENFEVGVLESNCTNLNEREIYWIKYYHTYYLDPEYNGGYNMTSGGENCESFTEAGHKRLKELFPNTNGAPYNFVNCDRTNAITAMRQTNISKWPGTNGTPPQFIEAGRKSLLKSFLERKLSGTIPPGYIGWNTSRKFIESGAEAHSQNSILRTINNYIQDLINKGLDITPYNYYNNTYAGKNMWLQHIPRVLKRLSELKSHPDWTDLMTEIFDHIAPNPDKTSKGKRKYIIN